MLVVLLKKTDYNTKVAKSDGEIAENKTFLTELETHFLLYISGNILLDGEDGSEAYLVFQPAHKYIKSFADTRYISEWKSKGLSEESIKPFPTFDNSLTTLIGYYSYNIRVKFNGSILRQPKVSLLFSWENSKYLHCL